MEKFLFFVCLVFSGPHPWHMEVPRLGVEIGAVATGLHHSHNNARSEPHMRLTPQLLTMPILNPLSKATGWTQSLMDTSRVCYHWATMGTPSAFVITLRITPESFAVAVKLSVRSGSCLCVCICAQGVLCTWNVLFFIYTWLQRLLTFHVLAYISFP